MQSRERITAYTQVSSEPNVNFPLEFIFKGKGKAEVNPPEGVYVQWAEKGSYRLPQMLETISHLPDLSGDNPFNRVTGKGFAIYMLDNYSIHVMPEVKKALLKRLYFPVFIGGGITGHCQVSMTTVISINIIIVISIQILYYLFNYRFFY